MIRLAIPIAARRLFDLARIRAQNLQKRRARFDFGEGGGDIFFAAVAGDIDEKNVFPHLPARRTRFEARHAHGAAREGLEHPVHRPRLVFGGHDKRGLVVAGRIFGIGRRDNKKPRRVGGGIFDIGGERTQAVDLGGRQRRDGGGARLARGLRGGGGVRGARQMLGLRQPRGQPTAALRERLRMRIHALDLVQARIGGGQKMMTNADINLAADRERGRNEFVENDADAAFARVFERRDGQIAAAAFDFAENRGNVGRGDGFDSVPESFLQRFVTVSAERPQKRAAARDFDGETSGDNLAENRLGVSGRERFGGGAGAARDFGFARGMIELLGRRGALNLADFAREIGAAIDKGENLRIDFVDRGAVVLQARSGGGGLGRGCHRGDYKLFGGARFQASGRGWRLRAAAAAASRAATAIAAKISAAPIPAVAETLSP